MQTPSKLLFLPGASGQTQFWQPVSTFLAHPAAKVHVAWPGFGGVPRDPDVSSLDDLVSMVAGQIDQPTALIAQSMGGVVALRAALRKPEWVTHLVLCVTSGGIDLSPYDAQDWRPAMRAAQPDLPDWFASYQEDLAPRLTTLRIPTLLLWGDADPISPVPVGQRLASLLPQARLHVFHGGDHGLAATLASEVAPLIDRHLAAGGNSPGDCLPVFRQAVSADIPAMSAIRLSVTENVLSDPSRVTLQMYEDYLEKSGRGWVAEIAGEIVAFSYADREDASIWALFVRPGHEGRGLARKLLALAVDWLFALGHERVHLSTTPGTRADRFYALQGWQRDPPGAREAVYSLAKRT